MRTEESIKIGRSIPLQQKIILVIVVAFLMSIGALFICSQTFSKSFPSVMWINNVFDMSEYNVEVSFDGRLSKERFTGTISIVGLPEAEPLQLQDVSVIFNDGIGLIRYGYKSSDGSLEIRTFGMLLYDGNQFSILPYRNADSEWTWSAESAVVISGPADTREDALLVIRELSLENEWLKNSIWR